MEDHHRKLAGLIKEAPRKEKKTTATDGTKQPSETAATHSQPKNSTFKASPVSTSSPTVPTSRRRLPQSSIATNLAEKRGIPSAKRTTSGTSVTAVGATNGRSEHPSTPVRDLLAQQARRSDAASTVEAARKTQDVASPPPEDNFRRFYSAFGGVISAISAPLAFTSLPLNPIAPTPVQEPPKEEKKTKSRAQSPEASRTVKSSVPDLAALISKPALRALRDDGAPPLGPNESFYLVPTSGGTVTYASVLRDPNAPSPSPGGHMSTIEEGSSSMKGSSHEEFVDARETVGPPSPTKARRPSSRGTSSANMTAQRNIPAGRGAGIRTMEELALENETLKSVIDKQAKRIQMWELNSQNSFNALAQSFRARGPGSRATSDPNTLAHMISTQGANVLPALPSPPLPSLPSSPGIDATAAAAATMNQDAAKRIADLEAMLARQTAKMNDLMTNNEQLAKQNERNAQVLGRYREQWEKLKAGARKKEQERREKKAVEAKESEDTEPKDKEKSNDEGTEEDGVEEPGFGKA